AAKRAPARDRVLRHGLRSGNRDGPSSRRTVGCRVLPQPGPPKAAFRPRPVRLPGPLPRLLLRADRIVRLRHIRRFADRSDSGSRVGLAIRAARKRWAWLAESWAWR